MRILRIELRRGAARSVAATVLLLAGVALYALHQRGRGSSAWDQQWTAFAIWLRFPLLVAWPAVLGAGAVYGLRDVRSRMTELLTTTPRPIGHRVAQSAGAIAVGLGAGYLGLLIVGGAMVAANTDLFHLRWLPIVAVGLLSLVAAAWLGMGLARLLPSLLTPPALVAGGLVALIVLIAARTDAAPDEPAARAASLLAPPLYRYADDAALTIAGRTTAGQAIWFTALAATGLGLLLARRAVHRMAAFVPAVAGAALALALFPADGRAVFVTDAAAARLVCADGTPRVCVIRAHRSRLVDVVGPAREALGLLGRLDDPPTEVVELRTVVDPPPAARTVPLALNGTQDAWRRWEREPNRLLLRLLSGLGTQGCDVAAIPGATEDAGYRHRAALAAATEWLIGQGETQQPSEPDRLRALTGAARVTLSRLPTDRQRALVSALRSATLRCDQELLAVLDRWR